MSHYKPYPAYKDSGVEWLGKVPEHWSIVPLKWCFECLDGKRVPLNSEQRADIKGEVPYWGSGGVVDHIEKFIFDEPLVLLGEDGAPFFDRDRPVAYAIQGKSWINNHIHVLRPLTDYPITWFVHALNCVEYRHYIDGSTRDKLTQDDMKSISLVIPESPDEARRAVAHLARETIRIDALIEKKSRFIELLREKRQALITHAVTKGLDPNVKMKDSGVEWLGEVPEHWGVKPLKLLVKEGSTISYGIVQPGEPLDEGVPFVQTTNMSSGDFEIESLQKTTPEIAAGFPRSRLTGGEVILGIRASIGAAFVVPMHLAGVNLSRGVARIDCLSELSSHFFVAYLSSMAVDGYWQLAKQGSTFNEVSIATVKELLVPVPPREEQAEIEDMLSNATARLNSILKKTERSIELLKERRSALITAAVTGQIDLREAV